MLTIIALPAGLGGLEILCLFVGMIYLAVLSVGRLLDFLKDSRHPRPSATPASGGHNAFGWSERVFGEILAKF